MSYSHTDEERGIYIEGLREVLGLLKESVEAGDLTSRLKGNLGSGIRKVSNFNMNQHKGIMDIFSLEGRSRSSQELADY